MKFKYIFLIFNILIVLFLLAVAVLPALVLGADFAGRFMSASWPLVLVLAAAMVGLNIFFLCSRRLFKLLEREDWPALVDYLEHKVIDTGRYSPRLVKLLANSYLIMSDSAGVLRLEKKLALEKPALLEKNALVFGAARILGGDSAGAADFFKTRLENGRAADRLWLRWYYGFALLLAGNFARAGIEFKDLAAASPDALIAGLSAWFLHDKIARRSENREECASAAANGCLRVKDALKGIGGWKKESAKIENEIHAAVIKKYIDEAALWLFRE